MRPLSNGISNRLGEVGVVRDTFDVESEEEG